MTPEQIEQLINRLLSTGEILATEGYKLAYRQAVIEGWVGIAEGIFLIVVVAVLARNSYIGFQQNDVDKAGFCGLLGAVLCVPTLLTLVTAIQKVLNPGWYAVEKLLGLF